MRRLIDIPFRKGNTYQQPSKRLQKKYYLQKPHSPSESSCSNEKAGEDI